MAGLRANPAPVGVVSSAAQMILLLAALLSGVATPGAAFNVDTENFIQHRGQPGSMFGFSVAEHRENRTSWVLVGAPRAQTSQPGVRNGGAVYKCDVTREDYCDEVKFDTKGNNVKYTGIQEIQLDEKSGQWFGATVRSSGVEGTVVACAPRYVYFSTSAQRRDPVGTCYVAKRSMTDFSEYSPCRTTQWGYHRQGYCQAGMGAHVSRDGQRLFIGAVGSWYWQGQVFSLNTTLPPDIAASFSVFGTGQVFSQNLTNRPELLSSKEGPPSNDDSYLGYSVTVGNFSGSGEGGVAVGMPRGASLLGKVLIFTWDLINTKNVTGVQLGAYFGYSVGVSDMDGDGLDDLIVGAPLHSDWDDNEGQYETGRIYVFYQASKESKEKFHRIETRDGKISKSRFGLSLSGLGDINRDKFEDIAVGSPYDGASGRGAVYIYHGSSTGIKEKPSQIIFAEAVNRLLTTFGFSVSGGMDLDENEYPDIVVGAYESDTAVYLKSRPVVTMNAKLTFSSESKQIFLEEKECRLRDNTPVACTSLNVCLEYSGVGVDRKLDFDIQYILDSKKNREPRMFFINEEGRNVINQTMRLDKGGLLCKNMNVYIKPNIRDKLTPIEAELKYSMRSYPPRSRTPRSLMPILDENAPATQKDSISIQKNCGKDNICIPDLRMISTPSVPRYLLGSGQRLEFDVLVHNEGEDAFESSFNMKVPEGINYVNIERIDDAEREIPVQCSAPSKSNNNTLRCDIGNPLPGRKLVHFKVLLQPFYREGMKPRYEFQMLVNSTNPEEESSLIDNSKQLTIPIWVETDLIIQGSSSPPDLHYNISHYGNKNITHESDIGPSLVHVYSIRNKGPSDILEATAYILWPTYILGDEHLLYLLEQPETSGPIKCEPGPHVNEMKVILDRKKKSYLESQRFVTEEASSQGTGVKESAQGGKGSRESHHEVVASWEESSENGGRGGGRVQKNSWSERESSSSGGKTYSSSSWSSWSSSSGEERVGGGGRGGRRKRAQSAPQQQSLPQGAVSPLTTSEEDLAKALRCGPTNCTEYRCTVGPLSKDEEAWIVLRSRVDVRTLKKLGAQEILVSSVLASRVTRLPHIGSPDYINLRTHEVMTKLTPTDGERGDGIVPWWVVVLSACAGTIILLLLIFLLWKCGFFKRNRPSDAPEKEPLNRNGHFQPGDEAL